MKAEKILDEELILSKLAEVKDPEIDTVSIVDLGMVYRVAAVDTSIKVTLLPTFSGCPALPIIEKNCAEALLELDGADSAEVEFTFSVPWTSDRVTEAGIRGLKEFGIAPPPEFIESDGSWHVDCPYCGSTFVTVENIFGPTACRSILYCRNCRNPFEAMKLVSSNMH
ncbi:1,2-phenylacetyl-CoA epoxidase subunit PaaD [Salinicoccus carnicancri]|uniref:1,2-phenylacetyl-CoA epoxidase subunit PaaD n=1 Tax=Salinicoccus carnicancri TaxID=558170 RepID=UPI0002E907A0|nr:1,2-phenylacetyl-CoA epoxidase subunit PaaD [Salinicoccus carnicancri]